MTVLKGKGAYYSRTTTPSFNLPSFDTRSPSRQDVSQVRHSSDSDSNNRPCVALCWLSKDCPCDNNVFVSANLSLLLAIFSFFPIYANAFTCTMIPCVGIACAVSSALLLLLTRFLAPLSSFCWNQLLRPRIPPTEFTRHLRPRSIRLCHRASQPCRAWARHKLEHLHQVRW